MERLIQDLLEGMRTREKLVELASDKLNSPHEGFPYIRIRDELRADLASDDNSRMVRAITHGQFQSELLAQLIHDELAELTGKAHEIRKLQFAESLEVYQAAKSNLVGRWLSVAILFSLSYATIVPRRELVISGLSGLANAIEKFDSKRGFTFGQYATWWVRVAMTRSVLDLRGWTAREVELRSKMRKLIGKERWVQWARSPRPSDVAVLGLGDQEVIETLKRGRDQTIYPIYLKGRHLTPECAGAYREWVQLSEWITTETNPVWWV
jgi:DNA-directed RNA polymerase sigma subunit (sigma70/sigma32)